MGVVVQAGDRDALRTRRPLPAQATNLAYEIPGCSRKCSTTDRCGTYANGRAAEKAAVQDFLEVLFGTRTGEPPPYNGTSQATAGNGSQRIWFNLAVFGADRFAADCHQ